MHETEERIDVYRLTYDLADSHVERISVRKDEAFREGGGYTDFVVFSHARQALLDHLSHYARRFRGALYGARTLRKGDL